VEESTLRSRRDQLEELEQAFLIVSKSREDVAHAVRSIAKLHVLVEGVSCLCEQPIPFLALEIALDSFGEVEQPLCEEGISPIPPPVLVNAPLQLLAHTRLWCKGRALVPRNGFPARDRAVEGALAGVLRIGRSGSALREATRLELEGSEVSTWERRRSFRHVASSASGNFDEDGSIGSWRVLEFPFRKVPSMSTRG
jgi:hypothetical protein